MLYLVSQKGDKYGYGTIEVIENSIILNDKVFAVYKSSEEANDVMKEIIAKHQKEANYDCWYKLPQPKKTSKSVESQKAKEKGTKQVNVK